MTANRRWTVAGVVATAVVLAGCGGTSSTKSDRSGSDPSGPEGRVTGVIEFVGGPYLPKRPLKTGRVSAFDSSGRFVATEVVHNGRRGFHFALSPGRYRLVVGRRLKYNYAVNCTPRTVRVRPDRTTRVTLETGCGIP